MENFSQATQQANEKLALNADAGSTDKNLVDKKLAIIRQALRGDQNPPNF